MGALPLLGLLKGHLKRKYLFFFLYYQSFLVTVYTTTTRAPCVLSCPFQEEPRVCGASAPLEWIHNSWPSAAREPGWGCATLLLDKDLFYLYRQGKKLAFLTPFFFPQLACCSRSCSSAAHTVMLTEM